MERLTTETLKEYFQNELNSKTIVFQEIDYEQPETADFSQEFKIATASIVLVDVEDGKTIASKNLANESWNTYTDESAFKEMLRENIDAMLKHEETESMKSSDIMVFEPDEEEDIILPQ